MAAGGVKAYLWYAYGRKNSYGSWPPASSICKVGFRVFICNTRSVVDRAGQSSVNETEVFES